VNDLRLEQPVDGLGQGIVIGIAHTTHRRLDAGFLKAPGIADGQVLAASVRMVDKMCTRPTGIQACSSASSTKSVRDVVDTFQQTMWRENTSVIKAT